MASPIQITVTEESIDENVKVVIVRFDGQLDESNIDDNAHLIYDLIDGLDPHCFLIFDFQGLSYMNSKSIGYLTDWHLKVTEKQGEIILGRARENILDILNVVGLTQIIKSFPTIDEAKLAVLHEIESR
jgi:anti-anti-sigma factor